MGPEIFAWIGAAGGLMDWSPGNKDALGANGNDQAVRRLAVTSISTFISGL
jgi:hypothetical protein